MDQKGQYMDKITKNANIGSYLAVLTKNVDLGPRNQKGASFVLKTMTSEASMGR